MIKLKKDKNYNFLLIRCDKIGDLVLSAQCAQAIKNEYKHSKVIFLVNSYTKDVLKSNPYIDKIICIDEVKNLKNEIIKNKIDISISLFADKKSTLAIFLGGIKTRIGNFSKIHSLLFNYKIKQNRSRCIKNEAQYNLDLLKPLGINKIFYPKIYIDVGEKNQALNFLEKKFDNFHGKKFIIIHPGSGGSGIEWGLFNYLQLANLLALDYNILISGSESELKLYATLLEKFSNLNENHLINPCSLREFICIISCSNLFISNSTGPLHCAIALDVQSIGLHTFKRPIDPIRWGPFNNKIKNYIITPLGTFTQKSLLDFTQSNDYKALRQDDEKIIDMKSITIDYVKNLVFDILK